MNTMKQHCKRSVGIMHTAKTLHLPVSKQRQDWCNVTHRWGVRVSLCIFSKNETSHLSFITNVINAASPRSGGTLRGICKQKRGTADLCRSLTLLAETGRLSNTDGQIYIDKAVMVDKREGMTDMERQKDGKQVFDQRPEGFFTRTSQSIG